VNFLENRLVEQWRTLIFETENQLKKFENTSDLTYEDKCIFEVWEEFLASQKSSLENYINFLNHKKREDV
jgi:hypothetical protein